MAQPLTLVLTPEQERQLVYERDHHPKPYVRERCAALLKVASGQTARQVAAQGLLKARHYETVNAWIRRYKDHGLEGLLLKPGRGRKPAFSPSLSDG